MRKRPVALAVAALLLAASAASAVRPQSWSFSTQKDFADGSFENTVVDSYGQLSLARQLTAIDTDSTAEVIAAFAQTPDGALYVATGRDPKIFRIDPSTNKSTQIYKAPKGFTDITAMAADAKGNLLVALAGGASGEDDKGQKARLIKLTPKDKPVTSIKFENDDVDYIWSIAQSQDGDVYLGTGPHGKVYKIVGAGNGKGAQDGEVILESNAKNILTLAFDKSHNLIAGTDAKGLVIRIDAKTQKPFILLDAGKVDVTAIVAAKDGSLFVTTAKADLTGDEETAPPDETETKSKPGKVEPETIEPPADDNAAPDKKSPHGAAPAIITPGIYATVPDELPSELKDLINKVQQKDPHKQPPATNKKPVLPKSSKSKSGNQHLSEPAPEESTDSSALYRISPEGSVTTLMQESDQNYALLLSGDDLLVGTGEETAGGKLFRYRLADESLTLLARLKQEQITSLFSTAAGEVLIGTANTAQVYRLESTLAKTGTFTSQVLDAAHAANFGHASLQLLAPLPNGAKITLSTRTSNIRDADGKNAKFWSDWSPELDFSAPVKIASPTARFLQYRITLAGGGGDGKSATPFATNIKLSYQTENLSPQIKTVTIDAGTDDAEDHTDRSDEADGTPHTAHITWDASDPNNDTLVYRLYYRLYKSVDGIVDHDQADADNPWSPLVHDLKDATFEWDTRSLPDGRYQVKVIASDKPDNTPDTARETARVSAPFTVNHTPPTLAELKASVDGNKATITGEATDALSPITDIRYQIDSQGDWQPAAPSDKIFDSLHEAFTIVTRPLAAGGHRITVRATDAAGNSSYKAAAVIVK